MATAWIRSLRPKQWTKNAVVFAAFIFALGDQSQQLDPAAAMLETIAAVILFCMVSSGVYLMNDLRDREVDRAHPVKRNRPIAAGDIHPGPAGGISLLLLAFGIVAGFVLDRELGLILAGYFLLQLVYSFLLKRVALLDVFIIASGFVLRALAGAVTIDVVISPWLLLCTLLLALFLALCKRRQELVATAEHTEATTRHSLRNYDQALLNQLITVTASATAVAYSMYTLAPDTVEKFGTHQLGFTIPFVLFGLFRYMDLVYRHDQGERPEQVLLTDPPLLVTVVLYGITVGLVLLTV